VDETASGHLPRRARHPRRRVGIGYAGFLAAGWPASAVGGLQQPVDKTDTKNT
jgi:hypothetical protein